MTRRLSLLLTVVLAFGLVSLAAAQQQDQPTGSPNPLVQLLQSKGVLTTQEAAAINQAPTPAEQQSRLTQLLYSKGIITQDEYKTTAAVEASRATASEGQGMWIQTAAHASAGEPEPAMAMPPQAPAAPAVIPAVAPVRLLTGEPPKAGGLVPDLKLGSGAKIKLYGFVKATATYSTSNPYNIGFELPGLGGSANAALPGDVPVGGPGSIIGIPGTGNTDSGPNGSPGFYLKGSATRMGANFEWPDLAGSSNTLTGRIETDWEGNFSRAQNRNVSSLRTRMLALRLAYARIDHKFTESTTGFILAGYDWTPFGSGNFANLLETEGGGAYFGSIYEREAQIRLGVWHNFGGSRNFRLGIEPAIGMPSFANLPADVSVQLGVSERQGIDSARPEVSGRVVLEFQLDKARGVPPAQINFSGMNAKRVEIVNAISIRNAWCGTAAATQPAGFPSETTSVAVPCAAGIIGSPATPGTLLGDFPRGANASSQRWGFDTGVQLPTRYFTLIARYYTGADLRWYFGSQVFGVYNSALGTGLVNTNGAGPVACNINPTNCPQTFSIDTSNPNVFFGFNPVTGHWQVMPQHPMRAMGGLTQLSFPLSRIFNANPVGRNAGWVLAFTYGTDQAKARDVRTMTATGAAVTPGVGVTNSTGQRNRSDMGVGTLSWKFNQFVTFTYESSIYLTRSTCAGTGDQFVLTGGLTHGCGTLAGGITSGNGTPFQGLPARYWHDWRNEFGPVFTF